MEYSAALDIKRQLRIVHVKDSEYQRRCYAIGITPQVDSDFKNKARIDSLPPAVSATLKSHPSAKSVYEGNNVPLLARPSGRFDA